MKKQDTSSFFIFYLSFYIFVLTIHLLTHQQDVMFAGYALFV